MSQGSNGNPEQRSGDDLPGRLDRLGRELDRRPAREADEGSGTRGRSDASGLALAMRVGSEFVAAVIVGGIIGWGVDRLAGSSPWGMIVFLMLGFVAGVLNVMRSAGLVRKPGE